MYVCVCVECVCIMYCLFFCTCVCVIVALFFDNAILYSFCTYKLKFSYYTETSGRTPSNVKIKMAVTSKEAKLESQLTCAICLDRYNDPRMLPCAHSYCKDCIDCLPVELEKGRHAVKCPATCRKPTLLEEGASALPIVFYINNMMEIHSDGLQKTDAKTDLPPTNCSSSCL